MSGRIIKTTQEHYFCVKVFYFNMQYSHQALVEKKKSQTRVKQNRNKNYSSWRACRKNFLKTVTTQLMQFSLLLALNEVACLSSISLVLHSPNEVIVFFVLHCTKNFS